MSPAKFQDPLALGEPETPIERKRCITRMHGDVLEVKFSGVSKHELDQRGADTA
jgi:hypothetical protein